MKLLALDTSSLACTAGVSIGGKTATRYAEKPREHTHILMPMIRDVAAEAGLDVDDLDAVVLGNGPGSFIGMRIAASVAQGLAFAAGIDIVPVSSLAAVAFSAGDPGDDVAVAQDAHMGEVSLGIYRLDDAGLPRPLCPEQLKAQAPIAELEGRAPVIAAGAGWERYPALASANREFIARFSNERYPRAEALLALGSAAFEAGLAVAPADVEPAYLRQEVAVPSNAGLP